VNHRWTQMNTDKAKNPTLNMRVHRHSSRSNTSLSMLRCFSTIGCPELSLEEVLALAASHGITAIELRALGGTAELPRYLASRFGSPAALAERLRGERVQVVAFDTSLRLAGGTGPEREAFLEYLPWAEALGVPRLRVFDGGKPDDAASTAQMLETIIWWRALRRERGWQADIVIETHDSLLTAAAINALVAAEPGAQILWDSHHTWKKGGEDPVATWRAIRGCVAHVHIKDSIGVPSARHPFTYVLPGDGEFPIGPLLEALRADRFRGPVSLEWEKMWHPYLPSLAVALETAATRRWW
jgi:sugar phosphate isomerase/epimerase